MIRVVIWKEFREQLLIGLTLVVLGSGVLIAAATLLDPPSGTAAPSDVVRYLGPGLLAALMLAVTAGMVCGGALFAAEREAGTAGFLESLPVSRGRLWRAKVIAGGLLAAVQILLVSAVASALGLLPTAGWLVAVLTYSLLAFCWGVLGSTVARTTLGSVGVAIPAAAVATFAYLIPIILLFPGRSAFLRWEGGLTFLGLMFGTPLGVSAFLYSREDRARLACALPAPLGPLGDGPPPAPPGGHGMGLLALVWLTARQFRGPAGILSAAAVVFGMFLLVPVVSSVLYWPCLALTAGVFAGVGTFADEQAHGTARFYGERRLPVGRVWAVKVVAGLLLAAWLGFLLAAPMMVRAQAGGGFRAGTFLATAFRGLLLDQLQGQQAKYLLLPLVYGFAAGHLCVLLFRKVVVAVGVAGLVGGTAAVLWVPSLLGGGLAYWQIALPPAVALLTAFALARAWAADRLATPTPLKRLAAGVAGVFLVLGAGLGWRVLEVPTPAGAEDDVRLVAELPLFDWNQTGRDFRGAAERFSRAYAQAGGLGAARARPDGDPFAPPRGRPPVVDGRLDLVIRGGWPRAHPAGGLVGGLAAALPPVVAPADPGPWLDAIYDQDRPANPDDTTWPQLARRAANLEHDDRAAGRPPGMFEDPRLIPVSSSAPMATLDNARLMSKVVLARGLQAQGAGDPAGFVPELRTALALARNMNHNGVVAAALGGQGVERDAVVAADRWVDWAADDPGLFRAVIAELRTADAADTFDPAVTRLAQRHLLRETMKAPAQWLTEQLAPGGANKDLVGPEVDLVAVAWTVPWEKERLARLVGTPVERGGAGGRLLRGRPGAGYFPPVQVQEQPEPAARRTRSLRRLVLLKVALRLYAAERGRPAAALDDLVAAGILPALPTDPHSGERFHYRVSVGGMLTAGWTGGRERTPREVWVPPGHGILWGVGADGRDGGATRITPLVPDPTPMEDDVVLLIPPARVGP